MSWTGISNTVPQYEEDNVAASGYYIKFYESGTTAPTSMSIDATGGTLLAKALLDSDGYPLNGSSAIFIPHIDQKYKIVLYRNETDADNNTFANAAWEVDELDPVVTISDSVFTKNFATLALAVADTDLIAGDALNIAERTTGNGGGATWDVVLSSTVTENTYNIVQSTGVGTLSLVLRIENSTVEARQIGTTGDNSADDNAALAAAFANTKIKKVLGHPSDTYRSTATLTMLANTEFDLMGGVLSFDITGKFRCLVTASKCKVRNGTVQNVTSDATVHGAEYQQPICIGFSNSLTDGVHDVLIENIEVSSTSPEGNLIFVFGDSYNVIVQNITVPDSTTNGEPFGGHWSVEPGGDETQGTNHPNNIIFRNIKIGVMSYANSAGAFFFSACRKVIVENVDIAEHSTSYAVQIFAGDHGFIYATDDNAKEEGTVMMLRNITGNTRSGIGITMADTLSGGAKWPSSIEIDNCHFKGSALTGSTSRGLELSNTIGLTVTNSEFNNYYYAAFVGSLNTELKIDHCTFKGSYVSGIDANGGSGNESFTITNNNFEATNVSTGTGYDIHLGASIDNVLIDNNTFDSASAVRSVYSDSSSPASNVKVTRNHVKDCSGTPFVFGAASSVGICSLFSGNSLDSSLSVNFIGGQEMVPYSTTSAQNSMFMQKLYYGSNAPSYEPSQKGDIVWNDGAVASGSVGWVCVTAGTPGTWKTFGAITA